VSFVADLSKEVIRKGAALFMPDLAIEIKSPDDSFKKMRETARFLPRPMAQNWSGWSFQSSA